MLKYQKREQIHFSKTRVHELKIPITAIININKNS